eukprot:6791981-Ditylum_brightwellii.AAC.1
MISCDHTRVPILYIIGEEDGTAASFLIFVECAVACGWLKQEDIIIIDNATIHIHSEYEIFPDMLWEAIGHNLLKTQCSKGQNTCYDAAA